MDDITNETNTYEAETEPAVIEENSNYFEPAPEPVAPVFTMPEPTPEPIAAPSQKGSGTGKIVAVALCCSILGSIIGGAGGIFLGDKLRSDQKSPLHQVLPSTIYSGERASAAISINHIDTSKLMTPSEVYALNVRSTVGITTSITTNFWGYKTTSAASGSGFILSDDGYILTNFHVVEDSNSITVSFYDGESKNAVLVGYDESNDIAILKVDASGLYPVILGDSDNLNVGDTVIAIGNPLGELTFSLTQGAVSALNREITLSSNLTMNLIQTDCAINSGNSGGPLFNLYGEVIGITNAKYSGSGSSQSASIDNIGFAIPINNVRKIVQGIIEKGYVSKPYIGVSVSSVSEETQSYGLPAGAAVKEVVEGGPAEAAGIKINDIITEANGKTISSDSDLVETVRNCEPDDILKLKVYRQGETINIDIKVGEKIQSALGEQSSSGADAPAQDDSQQGVWDGWGNWGLPDWFFKFGF